MTTSAESDESLPKPLNPKEELLASLGIGSLDARHMKRLTIILAAILVFALPGPMVQTASAKDPWTSVRSKNFLLIGDASEKKIREVGVRLEQFRETFSRLFPGINFRSPVPTTVIVFKSDASYRPFKPHTNTAGYFQAGMDTNYITLTTEVHGEQDPFNVIFHEYTHLLVNNTSGNVPVWFNEGLAEYYSTFSISNGQEFILGKPIASHVYRLRESKILPLHTLFQVDHHSPYYNERDKQSVFYAQSWALMHYLILGKNGTRLKQLETFMKLVAVNTPIEKAFQEAFQVSFETMENELREYVKRNSYPVMSGRFDSRLEFDKGMQAAAITEAEALGYLGDLLLHCNRVESETYLQKALVLDPNLAMANAAMGMLRIRQGKQVEARQYLERAISASPQNYLINYYHAFVLSREGMGEDQRIGGYRDETAAAMRAQLKQAIEMRPEFPESYKLLAFINLVTNTQLDESITLLQRVLETSPGRSDLLFVLAQVYMHQEDYTVARRLLENLSKGNSEASEPAQRMLAELSSREEQLARFREAREATDSAGGAAPPKLIRGSEGRQNPIEVKTDPYSHLEDTLRKPGAGEQRIQGRLTRVDCSDKGGITFVIKFGERTLRLRTDRFESLQITTFTQDVKGELTCGLRKPENLVVMVYLPVKDPRLRADGTARSLEFVPNDFQLKGQP